MAFGLLMTVVGLGALCALLYNCAVYALPVLIGLWVGFGVLHLGGGPFTAFAAGCISAGMAFGLCQVTFERARSNALRWVSVVVFVVPAMLVGYSSGLQLSALAVSSPAWQIAYGIIGAIAVAATAFVSLTTSPRQG